MGENSTFMRGGRLRKTVCGIISFAPFMAGASAVALGAVMAASMPAEAGNCAEEPAMSGMFNCTGEVMVDSQQSLIVQSGQALTVTADSNFGLHVANNSAIVIANVTGSTSMDVDLQGSGNVQAGDTALEVNHRGTGDADIDFDIDAYSGEDGVRVSTANTTGALTISTRRIRATEDTSFTEADGVEVAHQGSGNLTITTTRQVEADARGIRASHLGNGGSVSVTAEGAVTSGSQSTAGGAANRHAITVETGASTTTATVLAKRSLTANRGGSGIVLAHEGSGNAKVTAEQTITATGGSGSAFGDGIDVSISNSGGGGDLTIEAAGITADARGIRASHDGSGGSVTVTANGAIASGGQSSVRENRHAVTVKTGANITTANVTAKGNLTANRGGDGISISHAGGGNVKVVAEGTITATGSDNNALGEGIFIDQTGTGALIETYVKAEMQITSHSRGINVSHAGGGKVTVIAAAVTSNNAEGIHVGTGAGSGVGGVEITANGAIQSSKDGISVDHQGTGDVSITVDGDITTSGTTANCATTPANCERGIDVATAASGGALKVEVMGGTGSDPNTINTHDEAVSMRPEGSGPVELIIRDNANILSENGSSVYVRTGTAAERVTVNIEGDIGSSTSTNNSNGMSVANMGSGALDVDVTGAVRGAQGVILSSNGDADIYINSLVNGESGNAVRVTNDATDGADNFVLRLGSAADIRSSSVAMSLGNAKSGSETVVHLAGTIAGGSGSDAISFEGAANRRIVLDAGVDYTITGAVNAGTGSFDAVLEFTGGGDDTFDIGTDLGSFTGFNQFRKTGGGTWTFTGTHAADKAFDQFNINEGKVVWNSENPLRAASITLADGAFLEVSRATSWSGNLALSGRLEITGVGSGLELGTLTGAGGQIDMDVDFSDGDADADSPKLLLASVDGDSIAVRVRSLGGFPEADEDGLVTLGNLIQVTGTADADAFTVGGTLNGGFNFQLVHDDSSGMNRWAIVAEETDDGGARSIEGAGSIEQALYESIPAALTQFAFLESYQQRLQGRQHGENGGVWAKVSSVSAEFEPVASTLATHKIEDAVAEFGIDAPLAIAHPSIPGNFAVGATAALGDATTDVAVSDRAGKIETTSLKAAISVHWEYEGAYVDGQLQYATFDNDIGTEEMKLGSTNANAYSGGLEVGYGGAVGDLLVIPSAQLLWTSVDFEDFTDSEGMEIVLDDGVVVTGRAGVGLEYGWRGALYGDVPSGYVFLRGHADVLLPVDGDVNTRVDETEFVSKREDPVFDAGIGATYTWDGAYALSADVSTQQGEEVEGYAGSVGFKYKF